MNKLYSFSQHVRLLPNSMLLGLFVSCVFLSHSYSAQGEEEWLRVPAFTAYIYPDANGARVNERRGVTRWVDPRQSVRWYGLFRNAGEVSVKVDLQLPDAREYRFRLTIDSQAREVTLTGGNEAKSVADFGTFVIANVGYQAIVLESLSDAGVGEPEGSLGIVQSLQITGPATKDVHFNLKERRNAASVHLMYPVSDATDIAAFYCEVTAVEEPTSTFYMACGWHRGYFGMQVNSPTERRIIFSVWDSGNEAVDRKKVADIDRVQLVAKGDGVYSGDFGNEGTGGHSHLKVLWKTGEKQRFLVTAEPVEETFTIFSGYWLDPDKQEWMLISSWKAPKEGGYLKRPHSFSENFWGDNGHFVRKARYGNQWIQSSKGDWLELTTARFSHDGTGNADRLDRFMGVEEGEFFLGHGGFVEGYCKFGDSFDRPATNMPPSVEDLPKP